MDFELADSSKKRKRSQLKNDDEIKYQAKKRKVIGGEEQNS